jgi:hypothetical protein
MFLQICQYCCFYVENLFAKMQVLFRTVLDLSYTPSKFHIVVMFLIHGSTITYYAQYIYVFLIPFHTIFGIRSSCGQLGTLFKPVPELVLARLPSYFTS